MEAVLDLPLERQAELADRGLGQWTAASEIGNLAYKCLHAPVSQRPLHLSLLAAAILQARRDARRRRRRVRRRVALLAVGLGLAVGLLCRRG